MTRSTAKELYIAYFNDSIFDLNENQIIELMERYALVKQARIEELEEALRGIEPFASEVVSRQTNESVFGYNSEMLTLSSLKNIIKALNHDTINKP